MTPIDRAVATKLLQKLPEAAVSALDPNKLQILRIAGGLAAAAVLFFLPQKGAAAFLGSLLFAACFCLLREVAVASENELPADNPLLVFGDAACWLIFFFGLGFSQIAAGVGFMLMGMLTGAVIAAFVVADFVLRLKLKERDSGQSPPGWSLGGYRFDDFMYLLPIFAALWAADIVQVTWFMLAALLGSIAAVGFMFYRYYQLMAPEEDA